MYVFECDVRAWTRIPLTLFFWDEKCYGQDRSDHSGSDGPAQWREEAIKYIEKLSGMCISPITEEYYIIECK